MNWYQLMPGCLPKEDCCKHCCYISWTALWWLCARWIFYAVRYCGTVCYCLPLGDRCWGVPQITENSNCFSPRENLKYLQIKNVTEIFLCACVSGKTVLVLFLKVESCKTEKVLLYCCGSLLNTGLKKILSNILARNI